MSQGFFFTDWIQTDKVNLKTFLPTYKEISVYDSLFIFKFVVQGFEHGTSRLLGKHSITWATLLAPYFYFLKMFWYSFDLFFLYCGKRISVCLFKSLLNFFFWLFMSLA
jgi:hypothetical protein